MRRFIIHQQPHAIVATEIRIDGWTGSFDAKLRFRSVDDWVNHFAALGVPACTLAAAQKNFETTGKATFFFLD